MQAYPAFQSGNAWVIQEGGGPNSHCTTLEVTELRPVAHEHTTKSAAALLAQLAHTTCCRASETHESHDILPDMT